MRQSERGRELVCFKHSMTFAVPFLLQSLRTQAVRWSPEAPRGCA
jgi:hypothetical protein